MQTNPFPSEFCAKLAKILGMIDSAHDGEALSAARRATAMLKSAGLVWSDVLNQPLEAKPGGTANPAYQNARWRSYFREAWCWRAYLRDRDRAFLEGIKGRAEISEKQHKWLADIVAKVATISARAAERRAA